MADKAYNVLFLCTHNSARSVLAESLLNGLSKGRFRAFSAGSHPGGKVNPFAIELLDKSGLPTAGLHSKSWDEFAAADAPVMNFVFTVCDNAAGETCPFWPGQPMTAHWGVEDPAEVTGSDDEKRAAFRRALTILKRRIELLLALPIEKLDAIALQGKLTEIGRSGAGKSGR